MRTIAPQLHDGPKALDQWLDRLTMYGIAMVDAERQRRAAPAAHPIPKKKGVTP
jgi:hypothetical protein